MMCRICGEVRATIYPTPRIPLCECCQRVGGFLHRPKREGGQEQLTLFDNQETEAAGPDPAGRNLERKTNPDPQERKGEDE